VRAAVTFLVLLLAAAPAGAQSMKVTLEPPRLTVNEPGELSVEIIQEGPGSAVDNVAPVVPPQPDVAIRYIGPSTQVSIVNGRASQRVEHRYAISSSKAGTYTIGPITVRQQGALKEIGSVRLEVLASGAVAGPTDGESAQLSLTLEVPRTEVYLHEHIPLSLALRVGQDPQSFGGLVIRVPASERCGARAFHQVALPVGLLLTLEPIERLEHAEVRAGNHVAESSERQHHLCSRRSRRWS